MMFLLEELYFKRQDREQFVDIALDSLDAMLLPCPNLRRYIVVDRNLCIGFYIFCYIQIKAGIVDEYHTIRLPSQDILLTHLHIPKYRRQMHQDRNNTHIG